MVLKDLQAAINARVEIDDASVNYLAERAAATGLGVRWMKSQLTNAVDDLIFDDPDAPVYTVTIPRAQTPRKGAADPSDYDLAS